MTRIALIAAWVLPLAAAEFTDGSLRGAFHYQYLQVAMAATGQPQLRSQSGRITFDGSGGLAYDGGPGSYAIFGGGSAVLAGPVDRATAINARISADAAVIVGSSTESSGTHDLFIAVKAPAAAPALSGNYRAAALVFPGARTSGVRAGLTTFQAADAAVRIGADGAGTLTLPLSTPLPIRDYSVLVSDGGAFIVGAPRSGTGIFVAVKAATDEPAGLYWLCEMAVEGGRVGSAVGSARLEGRSRARVTQRWNGPGGAFDYRGVNLLSLSVQGTGSLEQTSIAAGGAGSLVGASEGAGIESLLFAVRAPSFTGSGLFLNPHGVSDSASLAPPGNPVASGALVSLFGAGLEGAGVEVNSQPAQVLYTSANQINILMPPDLEGAEGRVVVRNASGASSAVAVPLAPASPAAFSVGGAGAGPGIVTHADYSLVTAASPARPGEIVAVFATGAGVDQPPLRVLIGGKSAEVLYSGPSSSPGLDQVNVRVPAIAPGAVPLTLASREGFSDTVEIAVAAP